jgi:hypothetical protein
MEAQMTRHFVLSVLALSILLLAACYPPPYSPAAPSPVALATAAPTPAEAAAVVAAVRAETQTEHLSPDGRWRAVVYSHPCVEIDDVRLAYDELRLISVDSGSDPLVAHQLQNCEGLGAIGLGGLFWSANSRYFYYTDARQGVPDGGCGPFTRPTFRVDGATLETQRLGSGPRSPDGARLATWQEGALVFWDLESGATTRVLPVTSAEPPVVLAWSPDGQSLAYLQTESPCPPTGRATITRVNLQGLTQTVLLDTANLPGAPQAFLGLAWDAHDTLRIMGMMGEEWRLDLTTGALTK